MSKEILKLIVGIVVVVVLWKIFKGIVGLLVGVAVAALLVYGGMRLIEGSRNG